MMQEGRERYQAQTQVAAHNSAAVSWFRAKFGEIRSSGSLVGILPPDAEHSEGHLYLRGRGVSEIAGGLTKSGPHLKASHGEASIFTTSFAQGPSERIGALEIARVGIARLCFETRDLSGPSGTWAGADQIASCIYQHIARQTERDLSELHRIRLELDAEWASVVGHVKNEPPITFQL